MSRPRWVAGALVLAAVVLGLLLGRSPVSAESPGAARGGGDEPEVEMAIEASYGNWIASHRSYPVFVTLTADQHFRGTVQLDVRSDDGPVSLWRDVEVAGGSTERYGFVAPPSLATGIHELDVRVLDEDSQLVVDEHHEMTGANDQEVVGMLPDVAARSTAAEDWAPLAVDRSGVARLVPVDADVLGLGTLALDALDQLATSAAELSALPPDHRAAVLGWVDLGGELLVVGELAPIDGVLPDGWVPPAGGSLRAGLGAVRSVGEDWQQGLVPSPTRSAIEEDALAESLQPEGSVELPLARRARAHLAAAGGLGLLLVVYVLVLGPVLFFVTRALRRRQLVWVAVPVLALGSTSVVLAGGDGIRNEVGSVHVTVYETGPAGAQATTWSLLATTEVDSADATVTAELPDGWVATPLYMEQNDLMATGIALPAQIETDAESGRLTAQVSAGPGTYGMLKSQGAVPDMTDALVVEARSDADGTVTGTVRNQLDVALDHAVAVVGRTGLADLGTLAPGEEREFSITDVTEFRWDGPPEADLLPRAPWENGQDPDIPVARVEIVLKEADGVVVQGGEVRAPAPVPVPDKIAEDDDSDEDSSDEDSSDANGVLRGAWFETLWRSGWNYRPIGQVVVVGWTDRLPAPVDAGAGAAATTDELSAVVARTTVVPAGDRLTDAVVVRSYVRGPGDELFRLAGRDPDRTMDQNFAERDQDILGILYGFEVPPTVGERLVDPGRLTLGMPGRFDAAEVWTPAGWVPLPVPPHEANDSQLAVPLPPEAVVAGRVFLRATVPFGSTEPGQELVLYEREEGS